MIKHIIFDFDGTLVDSADDTIDCLQKAYQDILGKNPYRITRQYIGPPLKGMIQQISPDLPENRVAEIINIFRRYYDDEKFDFPRTYFYDNVLQMLQDLHRDRIDLFITTNKRFLPVSRILKKTGLSIFKEVLTLDIYPDKTLTKSEMIGLIMLKWHLDPDLVIMIGDTDSDIKAAKENRIRSAAVTNGYGQLELIKQSQPDYLLESAGKLYNLVLKLNQN